MHRLHKYLKKEYLFFLLIILTSVVSVAELFVYPGRSANMDGLAHITAIALFSKAMSQGDFPVLWVDGFGNYGYPLGMIMQQLTTYMGAFINLFLHNPVWSFDVVVFIGVLTSLVCFYLFLRLYVEPLYAFTGAFMMNLAPYRILNIYIRGALPEFFATSFLCLLLISLFLIFKKNHMGGYVLLMASTLGLVLTHPFMLIVGGMVSGLYGLFLVLSEKKRTDSWRQYVNEQGRRIMVMTIWIGVGIGIASYYLIPLNAELKYFYYGLSANHLNANGYLSIQHYLGPSWYYTTPNENVLFRGFHISGGIFETGVLLFTLLIVVLTLVQKRFQSGIMVCGLICSGIFIFLTTSSASFLYEHVSLLSNIQFPWRMLSGFLLFPPLLLALLLAKTRNSLLCIICIGILCVFRFPQMYGKNYTQYPLSSYEFTKYNLHASVMNTIWTAKTEDYPIKKRKIDIIEGKGNIQQTYVRNNWREYTISAKEPLRLVDYTFYFPGWTLYLDGVKQPDSEMQFQDPLYRGMITYRIPPGFHKVLLRFEQTKVRFVASMVSLLCVGIAIVLFLLRKKLHQFTFPTNKKP